MDQDPRQIGIAAAQERIRRYLNEELLWARRDIDLFELAESHDVHDAIETAWSGLEVDFDDELREAKLEFAAELAAFGAMMHAIGGQRRRMRHRELRDLGTLIRKIFDHVRRP